MRQALEFVSKAVGKTAPSSFIALTPSGLLAWDGELAAGHPFVAGVECQPSFHKLFAAVKHNEGAFSLSVNSSGKLVYKAGKVRATIDCLSGVTHFPALEGTPSAIDGARFVHALKEVLPFAAAKDNARHYLHAVKAAAGVLYATDGRVAVMTKERFSGVPDCVLPLTAVHALVHDKKVPTHCFSDPNNAFVCFGYEDGAWLRTQLYQDEWPNVSHVIEKAGGIAEEVSQEAREALTKLLQMGAKDRVLLTHEGCEAEGFFVGGVAGKGAYSLTTLRNVLNAADVFAWGSYPSPAFFEGPLLKGVVVGYVQ